MAVTVGHLLLISAQVTTERGVPMLEAATFGAFAEVQRGTTSAIASVRETWRDYVAVQDIRRDNERLRAEMASLRVELQEQRAEAQQTRTLQTLLELRSQTSVRTTAANVIAAAASPDFRTVTIDKGTRDGLRQDLAIISPEGVVGRLILPSARASKVQLLIDRNAAAGALVERSRAQGIVVGTGTDRLRLDYVPSSADVRVGDRVVTSGIEGIYPAAEHEGEYPKGFVIGQIESVGNGPTGRTIIVRPAVGFSALESVLVVLPPSDAPAETTAGPATPAVPGASPLASGPASGAAQGPAMAAGQRSP